MKVLSNWQHKGRLCYDRNECRDRLSESVRDTDAMAEALRANAMQEPRVA